MVYGRSASRENPRGCERRKAEPGWLAGKGELGPETPGPLDRVQRAVGQALEVSKAWVSPAVAQSLEVKALTWIKGCSWFFRRNICMTHVCKPPTC